jgi:hypothetical protein
MGVSRRWLAVYGINYDGVIAAIEWQFYATSLSQESGSSQWEYIAIALKALSEIRKWID